MEKDLIVDKFCKVRMIIKMLFTAFYFSCEGNFPHAPLDPIP